MMRRYPILTEFALALFLFVGCLLIAPALLAQEACPENHACLSWVAPSENVDGSELTDLAGFNLYWGTASGDYSDSLLAIEPDLTSGQFAISPGPLDLAPLLTGPVDLYFAMTAYDSEGNESAYSNEVLKSVVFVDNVPPAPPAMFEIQLPIRLPVPGGELRSQ